MIDARTHAIPPHRGRGRAGRTRPAAVPAGAAGVLRACPGREIAR